MDAQTYLEQMQAAEGTLYRVACAMLQQETDRRDAMQETALRAWEKRNTLRQEKYFQTWAVRIMINVCRDMYRQKNRTQLTEISADPAALQPDQELWMTVETLPEKQRLPLILYYREGFSMEDIARTLKMPVGTVKFRLHQGRKALRVELSDMDEEV